MNKFFFYLFLVVWTCVPGLALAAMRVDIYGPGQNLLGLALASPIKDPQNEAVALGRNMQNLVEQNLSFLPFLRLTDPKTVLGGTVLDGYEPPNVDFKRFQLAGSDILVTAYWPNGDNGASSVQMRAFETSSGGVLFSKEYGQITNGNLTEMADRFCADLLEALAGDGTFFRSTLTFAKSGGKMNANIWLVTPTGRNLRQITNLQGKSMSPAWSPDASLIVFSHIDSTSHSLGVWHRTSGKVEQIRFPGNVVIGPAFTPGNRVAVALSNGKYPVIYLLNSAFQKDHVLEQGDSINVSPTFDRSGTKMAFTSSRLGGPQIFLKDLGSGSVRRVSMNGSYNTEANLSPDGTLVVYSRMTEYGHRIFVQDLTTGVEKQISFGPGSDEQPSFCGDSYFIAFTSTRGGARGIYLTTRHGGDAKHVPTGGGNASFPRWGQTSKSE